MKWYLDNSRLTHNVYEAEWTDNYGNYGTLLFNKYQIYSKKIIIKLDSYCRLKDQEGNIFTQYNGRTGNELNAGREKQNLLRVKKNGNF